jgi:hypothetical protein
MNYAFIVQAMHAFGAAINELAAHPQLDMIMASTGVGKTEFVENSANVFWHRSRGAHLECGCGAVFDGVWRRRRHA